MQSSYVDQTLQCRDCGNSFVWTAGEQDFYESKHLTNSPTRCPTCRAAAKRARESGGRVAAARRARVLSRDMRSLRSANPGPLFATHRPSRVLQCML